MNRTGLVFEGGGGKGAYHIGVWKALRESGYDKNISVVSGTSVGALNALLFANGDYETAEKIWLNISPDSILKMNAANLLSLGVFLRYNPLILYQVIVRYFGRGVFTSDGIKKIIDENIDLLYVSRRDMKIFAGAYNISKAKMEYLTITGRTPEYIEKAVLASSALPFVFGPQKLEGSTYIDGGVKDNIPVKPVYDSGVRNIIVCRLNANKQTDLKGMNDASVLEIVPEKSQGLIFSGTLDFTPEGSGRRISQGYEDTVKIIEKAQKHSSFRLT
ncbi:MAG: patatin-like phospholipase family protein [Oscillospiraceae bacterium]|nr:patatin-like phospholipase family protein [Oscillospiraceae bacterium]